MTDLEMTRLCAEAMGHLWSNFEGGKVIKLHDGDNFSIIYAPLHDDAQAMALVKKMHLYITPNVPALDGTGLTGWDVRHWDSNEPSVHADFNRAIVECVAEMQASLSTREESK